MWEIECQENPRKKNTEIGVLKQTQSEERDPTNDKTCSTQVGVHTQALGSLNT